MLAVEAKAMVSDDEVARVMLRALYTGIAAVGIIEGDAAVKEVATVEFCKAPLIASDGDQQIEFQFEASQQDVIETQAVAELVEMSGKTWDECSAAFAACDGRVDHAAALLLSFEDSSEAANSVDDRFLGATRARVAKAVAKFDARAGAAIEGSITYVANKWEAADQSATVYTNQFEDYVGDKANQVTQKSGELKQKVGKLVEDKSKVVEERSTAVVQQTETVLRSISQNTKKYTGRVEGGMAAMVDKTKAASGVARQRAERLQQTVSKKFTALPIRIGRSQATTGGA